MRLFIFFAMDDYAAKKSNLIEEVLYITQISSTMKQVILTAKGNISDF
jgi:hypothetical protein